MRCIKPYHLFDYEGHAYLINVEDMTATIVDDTNATTLQTARAQPAAMLEQGIEEEYLKKASLLSEATMACDLQYPVIDCNRYEDDYSQLPAEELSSKYSAFR